MRKTYERPTWDPIGNPDYDSADKESKKYTGLFFNYQAEFNTSASEEECLSEGPNNVKFEVTCDPEDKEGVKEDIAWTRSPDSTACDIVYTTTSYAGCYWDTSVYFMWMVGFAAFIMIGVGLFMVFVGAKFIIWVIGAIVFFTVCAFTFAVSYSYGLFDPVELFRSGEVGGKTGLIAIIVIIASIAFGVLAAWYLTKHVSKLFLVLIAFQCGCILGFMILALIPF